MRLTYASRRAGRLRLGGSFLGSPNPVLKTKSRRNPKGRSKPFSELAPKRRFWCVDWLTNPARGLPRFLLCPMALRTLPPASNPAAAMAKVSGPQLASPTELGSGHRTLQSRLWPCDAKLQQNQCGRSPCLILQTRKDTLSASALCVPLSVWHCKCSTKDHLRFDPILPGLSLPTLLDAGRNGARTGDPPL